MIRTFILLPITIGIFTTNLGMVGVGCSLVAATVRISSIQQGSFYQFYQSNEIYSVKRKFLARTGIIITVQTDGIIWLALMWYRSVHVHRLLQQLL